MKSKDTRPFRAGKQVGEALTETANILYPLGNRVEYLTGIWEAVRESLEEAIKELEEKERTK